MAQQAVGNLQFPFGSQTISLSAQAVASGAGQSFGTIDIPSGTGSGVPFQIPFGSIANAKGYLLKAGCDIKVAFNGATGSPQALASGGFMLAAMPGTVVGTLNASCTLVTVSSADGLKQIDYAIFGD